MELTDKEREALLNDFSNNYGDKGRQLEVNRQQKTKSIGNILESAKPPGAGEATVRGALSGVSMGFEPQIVGGLKGMMPGTTMDKEIENEKLRNDQAWTQHPAAYGVGYGGGAVGLGLMTGGLGTVGNAARGIGFAAPVVSKTAQAVNTARKAMGTQLIPKIPGATSGSLIQGAVGAATAAENLPTSESQKQTPQPDQQRDSLLGTPLSMESKAPDFGTLMDFLRQANSSNSEEVKQVAMDASKALSENPDDEATKRRIAMQLQRSGSGRAVGNEDSDYNA